MGILNSAMGWNPMMLQPRPMQFGPTGSVAQMDPAAFITPQEKAAAEKAQRGDLMNQAMTSVSGGSNVPTSGEAGGLPGPMADFSGSFLQNSGGPAAVVGGAAPVAGAGAAAGGSGGLMASIMKFLPMLMGG